MSVRPLARCIFLLSAVSAPLGCIFDQSDYQGGGSKDVRTESVEQEAGTDSGRDAGQQPLDTGIDTNPLVTDTGAGGG